MKAFCRFCLFLLLVLPPCMARLQTRLACWNVENFFDVRDDTLTRDEEFTPQGENHWTWRRFADKRDKIYKTIAAMGYPAVVGLVEVENAEVLRQLCMGTPLRRKQYGFVHYDSPDPRGIDCALLYRSDAFRLLESRPLPLLHQPTRDVLLATGVLPQGDRSVCWRCMRRRKGEGRLPTGCAPSSAVCCVRRWTRCIAPIPRRGWWRWAISTTRHR